MTDPDLLPFDDVDWPTVDHRAARTWLEARGWSFLAEGDWARVFASPDHRYVARVSPFEPSYGWFIELCRRAERNPYFPTFHLVVDLAGGGQLAVLDLLTPVSEADESVFLQRWNDDLDPDVDLRAAHAAVDTMNAQCRGTVPFWMGVDIGDHVMRAADGHIQLIDLVGLSGDPMTELICTDIGAYFRLIPYQKSLYMLDIPYCGRPENVGERDRVAAAFTAAGLPPPWS